MKVITGLDPMSQEHMAERRTAVVDFISAALFRHEAVSAPGEVMDSGSREEGERT
jgi:hypothetical protein